jgi:hypothetical protein
MTAANGSVGSGHNLSWRRLAFSSRGFPFFGTGRLRTPPVGKSFPASPGKRLRFSRRERFSRRGRKSSVCDPAALCDPRASDHRAQSSARGDDRDIKRRSFHTPIISSVFETRIASCSRACNFFCRIVATADNVPGCFFDESRVSIRVVRCAESKKVATVRKCNRVDISDIIRHAKHVDSAAADQEVNAM